MASHESPPSLLPPVLSCFRKKQPVGSARRLGAGRGQDQQAAGENPLSSGHNTYTMTGVLLCVHTLKAILKQLNLC